MHLRLIKSKEKLLVETIFLILIFFYFFSCSYSDITWRNTSRTIIPRFSTIFPKYFLKISTNSLTCDTTLLLLTVILSSFRVSSVNKSLVIFQDGSFFVIYFGMTLSLRFFSIFLDRSTQKYSVSYMQI